MIQLLFILSNLPSNIILFVKLFLSQSFISIFPILFPYHKSTLQEIAPSMLTVAPKSSLICSPEDPDALDNKNSGATLPKSFSPSPTSPIYSRIDARERTGSSVNSSSGEYVSASEMTVNQRQSPVVDTEG